MVGDKARPILRVKAVKAGKIICRLVAKDGTVVFALSRHSREEIVAMIEGMVE